MEDVIKVIAKIEVEKGTRSVVLFFPETSANPGNITCWAPIGEHSEASMGYFWMLRNPSDDEAIHAINRYEMRYGVRCIRVCRDSHVMRLARWNTTGLLAA